MRSCREGGSWREREIEREREREREGVSMSAVGEKNILLLWFHIHNWVDKLKLGSVS